MDKVILKKFAIESRQDLMDKIKNKIKTFYIDEDFNSEQKGEVYVLSNEKHSLSLTNEEFKKRELLIKRVRELSLEQVIEEAAFTWFNRIIAIRYMEINDMLPLTKNNQSLGIRILSSKDNTSDPEILKFTNLINQDLDIDFKKEKFVELKDENEKFKYVLLLVCKKLGKVIPQVFDGITDYIDILIPDNLLNDTGFITKVVNEVPESNFNQVEIVGWLYQYYNQVEKDRVISAKKTYKKNEIAYATQLFTPDWIVKYMVENTLGKYWIEHNGNNELCDNWKYFIKDNIENNGDKLNPTDITFIDPCCGSGHVLVYAFEVFYQIYLKAGYNKNEIPELILKNNLYGLDIDDRAGQLSVLSVILKAREYDKNIFNKEIVCKLNIMSIQESNLISDILLDNIKIEKNRDYAKYLIDNFKNAKEIGSLLILNNNDYTNLRQELIDDNTIFGIELREKLLPIIQIANILMNKYDIVVTNPPYMSQSNMSSKLKEYVSKYYNNYKADLFSAFMIRNKNYCINNGYMGFLTPFVWMFISSFEKLRDMILTNCNITSIVQLEYNSFDAACVPVVSFVIRNSHDDDYKGNYVRLSSFPGVAIQEQKYLEAINDKPEYYFETNLKKMTDIPKKPIAYWLSEDFLKNFDEKKISDYASVVTGMTTADNNRFLRKWWEIDYNKIAFNCDNTNNKYKWYPYQKGGEYRKWYGNNEYVVNWENNGYEIKNFKDAATGKVRSSSYNDNYILHEGLSWTYLSNSCFGIRYVPKGFLFDNKGSMIFCKDNLYYILGFLCSKYAHQILDLLNPTMSFQPGDIASVPIKLSNDKTIIEEIVKNNIDIEKGEWDSFETSWDFKKNPIINKGLIKDNINQYISSEKEKRNILKLNEERLNMLFNEIYNMSHEIDNKLDEKDITYRVETKENYVKNLISYFVGCAFGRYSLDKDGLMFAGGTFDESNYITFKVDNDNIIPITDESYFSDDIVERFKTFIKTVYGDNTFNENMDFIAEALGKKGTETSEETIRRYFVNDFFNDHVKMYQKRPIYWLLDSGKKNGFKALIYMHRYNENLIPKARLDYLHRVQTTYEKLLSDVNYRLTTELSMIDKKEAKNRQADLNAKLNEIKEYDEKIAHIANQRISIDLDDGVKVNYEKFKDILAKIK